MTTPPDDQDDAPIPGLDRLDDQAGPARPLDDAAVAAVVAKALARGALAGGATAATAVAVEKTLPLWLKVVASTFAGVLAVLGVRELANPKPSRNDPSRRPAVAPHRVSAPPPPPPTPPEVALRAEGTVDAGAPEPAAPLRRVAPPAAAPRTSAHELLEAANTLRRERKWAEARDAYERVVREHPRSTEALSSAISAAALRREHLGDPRGALALLARARRHAAAATLEEELLWETALAARATADEVAERRALTALVERHGDSVVGRRARTRLDALPSSTR